MKKTALLAIVIAAAAAVEANAAFNTTCYLRGADNAADAAQFTRAICLDGATAVSNAPGMTTLYINGAPINRSYPVQSSPTSTEPLPISLNVMAIHEGSTCEENRDITVSMDTVLLMDYETIDLARTSFTADVTYTRDSCHSPRQHSVVTFGKVMKYPSVLTFARVEYLDNPKNTLVFTGITLRGNQAVIGGTLAGSYPAQINDVQAEVIVKKDGAIYKITANVDKKGHAGVPSVLASQDGKRWIHYTIADAK